jgi:hypothetical protein
LNEGVSVEGEEREESEACSPPTFALKEGVKRKRRRRGRRRRRRRR